jgi:hypothetical protein
MQINLLTDLFSIIFILQIQAIKLIHLIYNMSHFWIYTQ